MTHSCDKIFLLTQYDDLYRQKLQPWLSASLQETQDLSQANLLLADPPLAAKIINQQPQIDWVQSTFAGVDALLAPTLRQDYLLSSVKGIFGPMISEYVLGYLLYHYRHMAQYQQQQNQRIWSTRPHQGLNNQVMTILGTGSIGSHLAKQAKQMGIKVFGVNRTGIPSVLGEWDNTFHISELNAALEQSDIVVNTLPSTAETTAILNLDTLQYCRQVLLFNVGRGDAVDEAALIKAIKEGWVAHAFLDVFLQEPLPEAHPFWRMSAITLTPHVAAPSVPEAVFEVFTHNLKQWQQGLNPDFLVDFSKGY